MASYFFDTSALAKRYIKESGSEWVSELCRNVSDDLIFIADITEVELVSAIFRRLKGKSLTEIESQAAISQFDFDLSNQYIVLDINYELILSARRLVETHALRGYDAVQLAMALECTREQALQELPTATFVSADLELLAAASSEGIISENPNDHQ